MNRTKEKGMVRAWLRACMGLLLVVCCGILLSVKADAAVTKLPTKLTQTKASFNSIDFKWEKGSVDSSSAPNYIYEVSRNKAFTDIVRVGNTYGDSYQSCDGLEAATRYYVRIGIMEQYKYIPDLTQVPADVQWTGAVVMLTTPEDEPAYVKQTAAKTSQMTISWKKVAGANAYLIRYASTGKYKEVQVGNTTSYTIKGLSTGTHYVVSVHAAKKDNGYLAVNPFGTTENFQTVSAKVTGLKNLNMQDGSASFAWNPAKNAIRYELAVTTCSDKWSKKKTMTKTNIYMQKGGKAYFADTRLKNGSFYKARVRSYVLLSNGKKAYSAWSSEVVFGSAPKAVNAASKRKYVQITWSKVAGATGYQIYVSDKEKKGYEKVATVKSNTTKYTLKKLKAKALKSKHRYYIRIVPIRKSGKTTVKLNTQGIVKQYQQSVWYYKW